MLNPTLVLCTLPLLALPVSCHVGEPLLRPRHPSAAAAAAAAATTTAVEPSPTDTVESYTSDSLFRSSILDTTNAYRTLFSAQPVAWNDTLANFAAGHAAGCTFVHSGGPYGENLAAGYPSAKAAVQIWGNESAAYNYGKPGFSERTGHFTQLVWKDTTTVGCGRTECDGRGGSTGWYVVCEYWPRGNVIGQFREEVGALNETAGSSGPRIAGAMGRSDTAMGWSAALGLAGAVAWVLA